VDDGAAGGEHGLPGTGRVGQQRVRLGDRLLGHDDVGLERAARQHTGGALVDAAAETVAGLQRPEAWWGEVCGRRAGNWARGGQPGMMMMPPVPAAPPVDRGAAGAPGGAGDDLYGPNRLYSAGARAIA
jgi:hypothetical protein